MSSNGACANCGASLAGPYCHACGQHESASHPATLGHLLHEVTHELLHVDGKIWRTARSLFTRPGELTAEYWAGRRARWLGPFRVFLIAAAAVVLFVPGIGPMNLRTLVQRKADGGLDLSIGSAVERRAGMRGMTPIGDDAARGYQEELRRGYAAVRYAAIPISALATRALYRRRQRFYANHVVLGVHFYSFWYLVSLVTNQLPYGVGASIGVSISAIYLFLALRRLYGETALLTVVKSAALFVVMLTIEGVLAFLSAAWISRTWQ